MSRSFTSKPVDEHVIEFDLDGEEFKFTPPKGNLIGLQMGKVNPNSKNADSQATRAVLVWLGVGLNPDHEARGIYPGHSEFTEGCQGCRLEEKLLDPKDPLTMETVVEAAMWLLEEASGVPPTPSSDS